MNKRQSKRLNLIKQIAREKGGQCLSVQYITNKDKLRFQCKEGHEWEAIPSNILRGHWCKICGNIRQGRAKADSIERMQYFANDKGGKCLTKTYTNNNTKLKWECEKGHTWNATPDSVKRGTWCPICKGKLPKDEVYKVLKEMATDRKGALLSDKYLNAKTKLKWQCEKDHIWDATPDSIKRGSWCPTCAGTKKLKISGLQKLANERGGKVLSEKYLNSDTHLLWQCSEGHSWQAKPYHVKNGSWCPICSTGISERIFCAILEYTTEAEFPKKKPKWLRNSRGNRMELDGFNETLGIAFEYQGEQHYKDISIFHQKNHGLKQRILDDKKKAELCKKNDVYLIAVPYTIDHEKMQKYIVEQLSNIPDGQYLIKNRKQIKISQLGVRSPKRLTEMKALAQQKGGECLSDFYINNNTKLKWRCNKGHEWWAVPTSVKNNGTWCQICAQEHTGESNRKYDIAFFKKLAIGKGGKCHTESYKNSKNRLDLECKFGHRWNTQASVLLAGHWCQKCEKIRLGKKYALEITDMDKLAAKREGKCLSTEYINNRQKLLWECAKGHQWEAIGNSVKRGTWCPICAGKLPRDIAFVQLKNLAISREGKLLSDKYIGSKKHYKWQCKSGHQWEASATNIKRGTWCPYCAGKKKL